MTLSFRTRYVCYNYVGGEFVQEVTSGKLSPGHTVSVWLERMLVDLATGLMSTRIVEICSTFIYREETASIEL